MAKITLTINFEEILDRIIEENPYYSGLSLEKNKLKVNIIRMWPRSDDKVYNQPYGV